MKTRKHPSNSSRLKKLQSDFDCGGCNAYFDSAYLLHDHMRDHVEGGSYFYDNSIQTAFPISTKTEAATQTCPSDLEDLAGANELAVFAPSIKHEESSDTDTNNEYDDWNAVNEVNGIKEEADKTTGRDTTQIHDAKQNHALNDQVTVRQSADSKRRMASNDRISRTRSSTLKHSKANVNSNLVVSDFSKQASHHIQDVRVSLTRIDDDIISKKNHKSTVKNENGNLTKDLGENDDGLTLGKYRKLRPTAGKEKKKLLRKSKKSIKKKIKKNLDETNVSDPDFNPGDEELPESPYPMDDDDYDNHFDISEADTDDPHWQIAKIECKNMKCEHCDKFTESMFSKLNLLALHRIPFRQENGRIFIKGKKVLRNEQTGKNYVEESEIDFVIDKEAARETFICDECGGTYKDRNNFLRHKKIHTHSLACPHCDYTPTSRKHLRTHLKTHKQKTALQCDFCGMVFNHKKGMVRHVRAVHLGQKRYVHI